MFDITKFVADAQLFSTLITAAAVLLTSITVIIQTFTKYNPLNPIRAWFNKPVSAKIDALDLKNTVEHNNLIDVTNIHTEKLEEIGVAKLKSDICNPSLPLSERVMAGKKYVEDLGLNGEVSVRYKIIKEEYESALKGKAKRR